MDEDAPVKYWRPPFDEREEGKFVVLEYRKDEYVRKQLCQIKYDTVEEAIQAANAVWDSDSRVKEGEVTTVVVFADEDEHGENVLYFRGGLYSFAASEKFEL